MARTDYDAAWHDLAELILTREGWGSKALAAEMMRIAAKHRVSESLLERTLRLYGGEILLAASTPEAPPNCAAIGMPVTAATVPDPRQSAGGHDGHHHHTTAAEPVPA